MRLRIDQKLDHANFSHSIQSQCMERWWRRKVAVIASGAAVGLPLIIAIGVDEVTGEGVFRNTLTNRIDVVVVDRSAGSRVFKEKQK